MILNACSEENTSMIHLQESIIKLSKVADKVDSDKESIWAYDKADSITRTMQLTKSHVWKDLAISYSALSHIGYGMSYTRTIRKGDINLLKDVTNNTFICNPDTIKPNMHLHDLELQSDASFILFYYVSDMPATKEMQRSYNSFNEMKDSIYTVANLKKVVKDNIAQNFMEFQMKNRDFFFVYGCMLSDLFAHTCKTNDEQERKVEKLVEIGEQLDGLPVNWSENYSDLEFLYKQIDLKAKLIGMLADEISLLE